MRSPARQAISAAIPGLIALAVIVLPHLAGAAAVGGPRFAKRGVASSRFLSRRPAMLTKLGASWAYDWSATSPPGGRGPEWVPMIWGSGSVTPRVIAGLRAAHRAGRVHELLAFNEPDSAAQSNLTPARAAALWPALQRTGLALGSPAPAVATDGWLARFMTLARRHHLRVNFIALHYYQDFTDPRAVPALRAQLTALHRRYRLPLWITEIGAIDLRAWHEPMHATPTAAGAVHYMRRVFAMLDGLPFVGRYAWFTDDCWNHADCRDGSLYDGRAQVTVAGSAFQTAP